MALAERDILNGEVSDAGVQRFHVTKAQYHQMRDLGWFEGRHVELIEGVIYEEMSPMGDLHSGIIGWLSEFLPEQLRGTQSLRVQLPLNVSFGSEPEPDIAFVAGSAKRYIRTKPTTANLVIEVAYSSLQIDRQKADLYARAAVPEYWIVDLDNEAVEVYRQPSGERETPGSGKYAESFTLRRDDTISPLAEPAIQIAIADLLP